MKWLSLILQLASFRRSMIDSRAVIENAKAAAERTVRAAIFTGCCLVAAVFFFAGVITAVIELGLQVDRGEFFRFSGLLGSACAFFVLTALIVTGAWLGFRNAPGVEEAPAPPPLSPEEELKRVGAQIALRFLSKLKERGARRRDAGAGSGPKA